MLLRIFGAMIFVLLFISKNIAQNNPIYTSETSNLLDVNLEDLMNVKIVSASRKSESVFDAPVTSYVLTRYGIEASGALCIPEALRICPGLIVRENSPGSFDVSIRGGVDGLPTYQYSYVNTTILAMIDNRPVFNNFQGGTYWANLPISLIDVERIEVVLGPSSPLYGPNAVSGVVNIITRKPNKDGINVHANSQYGTGNSSLNNLWINYKFKKEVDFGITANAIARKRTNVEYYDPQQDKFVKTPQDFLNKSVQVPGVFYDQNLKFGDIQ